MEEQLRTQPAGRRRPLLVAEKAANRGAILHLVTNECRLESAEEQLHYAVGSRPVTKLAQ